PGWLRPWRHAPPRPHPELQRRALVPATPLPAPPPHEIFPAVPWPDVFEPAPGAVATAEGTGPEEGPPVLARLVVWLLTAYLVGMALLLGRWLLGYVALGQLLRDAQPAPAPLARLLAGMAHGHRTPRLLTCRRLRAPISCGLLRPTVVLPTSLCELPDFQKLRWVFAHELTHLERRDAWSALLFGLGQAVYFVLPWFWWLRRQVRLCQEFVADAAATAAEAPPADYAAFLLSLTGAPEVPLTATGVGGNTSDLYRRVTMLLK